MKEINQRLRFVTLLASLLTSSAAFCAEEDTELNLRRTASVDSLYDEENLEHHNIAHDAADREREELATKEQAAKKESFLEASQRKLAEMRDRVTKSMTNVRNSLSDTYTKAQKISAQFSVPTPRPAEFDPKKLEQSLATLALSPDYTSTELEANFRHSMVGARGDAIRIKELSAANDIARQNLEEKARTSKSIPDQGGFVMVDKPTEELPNQPAEEPSFFKTLSGKITDYVNKQVDYVNDYVNRRNNLQTAKAMYQSKAEGTFDTQNQKYLDDAMKNLTTKEKEEVAQHWLQSREMLYRKELETLKKQYSDTQESKVMTNDKKEEKLANITREIAANRTQLSNETIQFKDDLAKTLPGNEQIVLLADQKNPNFRSYEILNMSKIDPSKSIADQMNTLHDNMDLSTHISYEGTRGKMTEEMLKTTVVKWISQRITIDNLDPNDSITQQLNEQIGEVNGKNFAEFDPSMKQAIIDELPAKIQNAYQKELNNTSSDVKSTVLANLTSEEIPHFPTSEIQEIKPEAIAQLTDKQVNAFTNDQLESLTTDQVKALTSSQLETLGFERIKLAGKYNMLTPAQQKIVS